jgi:hypothetical protein
MAATFLMFSRQPIPAALLWSTRQTASLAMPPFVHSLGLGAWTACPKKAVAHAPACSRGLVPARVSGRIRVRSWPASCVCTSVTPFLSTCPRARAPCASTPSILLPPLSLAIVYTHQNQTLVSFLGVGYLSIALAQLPPLVYRSHIAPCISLPLPLPLPLAPARFASIATAT